MTKIAKHLKSALRFLSLLDRSGNVSVTNATLFVLTFKLAVAPTFTIPEVAAFFLAILNYGHKRHAANKATKDEISQVVEAQKATIDSLSADFEQVKESLGDMKQVQEEVKRLAAQNANSALHQALNNPRSWRSDKP